MNEDLFPDLDSAIAAVQDAGYRVVTPRKTPDERVAEEAHQIEWALDRMESAIREGGSLHSALIVDRFVRRLNAMRSNVLTPVERSAAE